jgi:hypothetical protein
MVKNSMSMAVSEVGLTIKAQRHQDGRGRENVEHPMGRGQFPPIWKMENGTWKNFVRMTKVLLSGSCDSWKIKDSFF